MILAIKSGNESDQRFGPRRFRLLGRGEVDEEWETLLDADRVGWRLYLHWKTWTIPPPTSKDKDKDEDKRKFKSFRIHVSQIGGHGRVRIAQMRLFC